LGAKMILVGMSAVLFFFLKKKEYDSHIHQQYLKGFVTLPVVSHLNIISRIYLATF
jgi:hypothetical protein